MQQWIGLSGKEFKSLKYMVESYIPYSCVWKKIRLEEKNSPYVLHKFLTKISNRTDGI